MWPTSSSATWTRPSGVDTRTERGVTDYPLEQCRDDYAVALLLPASRMATAVGLHPGLTATPDGFWNVVFPRYARALTDLGVSELLEQHYG